MQKLIKINELPGAEHFEIIELYNNGTCLCSPPEYYWDYLIDFLSGSNHLGTQISFEQKYQPQELNGTTYIVLPLLEVLEEAQLFQEAYEQN